MTPRLSVVVPAYRDPEKLAKCIAALRASDLPASEWELIVADDGSNDAETSRVASTADLLVTLPAPPGGPARARNAASEIANAQILAFVDADVLVHRDALRLLLDAFENESVAAVFGSYDDTPAAPGFVSQYRNLLHHYVHGRSAGDVESFWAGCGAVRKKVFDSVGGYDMERYRRPEMEDVELGYRLRDAGQRIVLNPAILCTHLKKWTLGGMIVGDFSRRGVPWARLLVDRKMLLSPRGLSLGAGERASAMFAVLTALSAPVALFSQSRSTTALALMFAALFIASNAPLLSWFSRQRGIAFAIGAAGLHFIYSITAVSALIYGAATGLLSRRTAQARYRHRQ